jgi:preprotein translocase subunit YajC
MDANMFVLLAQAGGQSGGGGLFQTLILFGAIGAIMYFLVIRPQQQERKAQEALLSALAKDMKVVTSGGIHGKVVSVGSDTVVLDLGNKARVTMDKSAVARRANPPADDATKKGG